MACCEVDILVWRAGSLGQEPLGWAPVPAEDVHQEFQGCELLERATAAGQGCPPGLARQ